MFVNSDFSELLRLFNANQVRYLVIGGYALIQYAEPRYTKDLDLWISTDATNAKAVYRARGPHHGQASRGTPPRFTGCRVVVASASQVAQAPAGQTDAEQSRVSPLGVPRGPRV